MGTTYLDRFAGSVVADMGKQPVDAATTVPITLSGYQTVDGVALNADWMRCLVKNQVDATTNGIYVVMSGAWFRAGDFAGPSGTVCGQLVYVTGGTQSGLWQLTTANPVVIDQSGGDASASDITFQPALASFVNPPGTVNTFQFRGSATAGAGVAYIEMNALGGDAHLGVRYKSWGTTTADGQFNGFNDNSNISTTGRQEFLINGVLAVQITDDDFNPSSYSPIDGYIVLSSGSSQGGTETSVVIGAAVNPSSATATSATARINAMGENGEVHFVNNGMVGVSVSAVANPNGTNKYCDVYGINLVCAPYGSGNRPAISVQSSDGTFADNPDLLFYHAGSGGFTFASRNTLGPLLTLANVANSVNGFFMQNSATGNVVTMGASGSDAAISLGVQSKGNSSGVYIYNGSNVSASFFSSGTAVNGISVVASPTGVNPSISAQGTDAALGLNIYTEGTGNITFATSNTSNTILTLKNSYDVVMGNTAQATNATTGFPWIPSCAGAPTGAPSAPYTNAVALMYDRTNNKIYSYNGAWKSVALT